MVWVVVALALSYVVSRRMGLGVDASVLSAVTFGASGAVLGASGLIHTSSSLATAVVVHAGRAFDAVTLGVLVIFIGLVVAFRRVSSSEDPGEVEPSPPPSVWLPGALGLGLAFTGVLFVCSARGLAPYLASMIVPDARGIPGTLGSDGRPAGAAVAWIAFAGLAFALAGALDPGGRLRAKPVVLGCAAAMFLLGLLWPGSILIALALACLTGWLAGDGLERATRAARGGALCILLPAVIGVSLGGRPAPLAPHVTRSGEEGELLRFVARPSAEFTERDARIEGWLFPSARIESARVLIEGVDADGSVRRDVGVRYLPLTFVDAPSTAAVASTDEVVRDAVRVAPVDAMWFRASIPRDELPDGHWRFRAEFFTGEDVEPVATRTIATSTVRRSRWRVSHAFIACILVMLALPWRVPRSGRFVVLCALLQALIVSRDML